MNPLLLSPQYFPSSVSSSVYISIYRGFPGGSLIKNPTAKAGDVEKILWRRKWQTTSVFLPGNPMDREAWHGRVHGVTKESDTI